MGSSENDKRVYGVIEAIAVPHPPLIVPEVGKGEEAAIGATINAYEQAAEAIVSAEPDIVVLTSPHAPLFRDGFFISDADELHGDMSQFRAPQAKVDFKGDRRFADRVAEAAKSNGITVAKESELARRALWDADGDGIDHGSFVPLYFLDKAGLDAPVVRIGLSGLSPENHKRLGRLIAQVANEQGKRVAFVASGDLSHKLKEDGPYGFDPAGPVFDREIARIFDSGDLDELFTIDEQVCEDAAECGLRSFQIMAGALEEQTSMHDDVAFESELLSCEGPFGVGYGIATFTPSFGNVKSGRDEGDVMDIKEAMVETVDPYVALARQSVEGFVRNGISIDRPDNLPEEMLNDRAGVFVSLHDDEDLRGCIGTIGPTKGCIADEVIANGVSACSQDPRFSPVKEDELDHISYSVDVLGPTEPISSPSDLDPRRYGVIVEKDWRRGLLLPNLDGVDTVEKQLMIAKQKAGINPYDDDVDLFRFEVIRHDKGGEARI